MILAPPGAEGESGATEAAAGFIADGGVTAESPADLQERLRDAALEKANRHKTRRSRIREGLRNGDMIIPDILDDPAVATMSAEELVSLIGWGPRGLKSNARTRRVLRKARVSQEVTVEHLSVWSRDVLLTELAREGHERREVPVTPEVRKLGVYVSSETQRMPALERANEIRFARARMKREVKRGELPVVEALDDPMVENMPVAELLWHVPHGKNGRRSRKGIGGILRELHIGYDRPVGRLVERQREELLAVLDVRGFWGAVPDDPRIKKP